MPLYEYQCKTNGHRFEVRHGVNDPSVATCPECGAEVRRVIQPVGIVFKGKGFYATDSRSSGTASKPAESAAANSGESGKTEAKSDSKTDSKSEKKPDAKPESKAESKAS